MVGITLTARFNDLNNWPGRLLEVRDGATVVAQTATAYTFVHPAVGVDFPNYRVQVTGTGFTYNGGEATAGNITGVRIFDAAGNVVISFAGFAANTVASDLSQFWANVFGNQDANGNGPSANGFTTWSHLMSGNDVITGTSGNDRQQFAGADTGNDRYNMGAGDDQISGGIGNDTMAGGDGFDRISFRETTFSLGDTATRGIAVNVAAGTIVDCWGGTDRFSSVEAFEGSRFNDSFTGDATRNEFSGLRGNDVFRGGGDQDTLQYESDHWQGGRRGIVVDLETAVVGGSIRGTVRDGFGHTDTTFDIERVSGTRYADVFVGSSQNNVFWGGEGRDSFDGAGGTGDIVRFHRWFGNVAPGNVTVDLTFASGQIRNDGFGNVETATRIEAWEMGRGNDVFRGNSADNRVEGNGGADVLTGGGGNDSFVWDNSGEIVQRDRIPDFVASGALGNIDILGFNVEEFQGMTGTLRLVNGTAATVAAGQFIYNAAIDTLFWDRDGTGAVAAVAVVRLDNVASLSAANFDLFV